ncbi:MAG TPA: polyphosphate polymerase domain-containing protein [bacterium]|mgnify:CR=1 FL=1|nr:polyphosphate polymerase domain-containing protein [bacterium]HNT65853.1 polyphosphate polymerase domain-containing protein [bacterium]HOX86667.1 polyphosphate polymerase domain-containing protein [bacterium]HPG46142.1 polyphosphate polymerase domain-containing protein [bacterium]HPM98229.1 polyphosphate polymerase domain-containing protein [bacterium]
MIDATQTCRREYKYLVPVNRLDDLRNACLPYLKPDAYAAKNPRGQYRVRSLYLDTAAMTCYHEKIDGKKNRNKYRIRGYETRENDSIIFLEIKRKRQNHIAKNRAPLYYRNLPELLASSRTTDIILPMNGKDQPLDDARKFLYHYRRKNLQPVILINYDREAFFGKFDPSFRLTFDKNICSMMTDRLSDLFFDGDLLETLPGFFVFEIKFYNRVPSWIKSVIHDFSLHRRSLSKYIFSLDSHRQFKKSRTLRRRSLLNCGFNYAE